MRIAEKTKIPWGSQISLVIAGGLENKVMAVPTLTGMSYMEAKLSLEESGIGMGAVMFDGVISDTAAAFVIKQRPERYDMDGLQMTIRSGQLMDIWISQEMKNLSDSTSTKK